MNKLFAPGFLIALVVLIHAFIGIPNYTFYSKEIGLVQPFIISLIFVLALLMPVFLSAPTSFFLNIDVKKAQKLSLYMLVMAMSINAFYVFVLGFTASGGFLERFSRIPILINLSQLGIPASLMLFYLSMLNPTSFPRYRVFLLIIAFMAMQMSLGYRSPIFILALSLFTIHFYFKREIRGVRLRLKDIIIILSIGIAGAVLISLVAIMRVESDYSYIEYYTQISWTNVSAAWDQIIPFAATIRADYVNLELFLINLKLEELFPGSIFFSDLITWLPGTQLGSRNIVGDYVGARLLPNGIPMSITVSLHGIIYSDFGYLGVFIFGYLISSFLMFLQKSIQTGSTCLLPLFAFVMINIVKSIHSGYLDFSFYFQILALLVLFKLSSFKILKTINQK